MHEDVVKEWFDLPHATLVRSLNNYIEETENNTPSRVH
jgi:hypothetical protein